MLRGDDQLVESWAKESELRKHCGTVLSEQAA